MADVILGNKTYTGVESVKLDTTDGGTFLFTGDFDTTYVVGEPVTFTLAADQWNGSMYTLYAYLYAAGDNGVQIGLPSKSSSPNTQAVINSALTINNTYNYKGTDTAQPYCRLYIIAVEPPTEDIEIALFGLTPVADTVVAAVEEETV